MSPTSIKLFRSSPSPTELNGPVLSFSQQPVSVAQTSGGSVTFSGIVTATFPSQSPSFSNKNLGTISYQWFEVGIGSIFGQNSNSLTITNLKSPVDSGRKFYLQSEYTQSSYTPGVDSATPKAINSPLNSDIVSILVYPEISITNQPQNKEVAIDNQITFSVDGSLTDNTQGNITYGWQINDINLVDGSIVIGGTNFIISGSNTKTLTITSNNVGVVSVRSILTHPVAGNSPLYSNYASLTTREPKSIIKIEGYSLNSSSAVLSEVDLDDSELVITKNLYNFDWICLYASEKDVDLEMDLYAAKGNDVGSFSGGEGGYSRINFTMQKNEEHIISGIGNNSAIFLYRKSSLISVVGSGGDAGISGNGGAGGGIDLSGSNATNGGSGGQTIPRGSLDLTGVFGSIYRQTTVYDNDTVAVSPNGGQTIVCSKGVYWREQGKSPCQDLGVIKFYLPNGTELTNSSQISRGFKSGYSITQTSGLKTVIGGGNGGSGATGGRGSANNFGGGGGSGYSDGTVNIIQSTVGGSIGQSRVNVRLFNGNFYVDSLGRILIFSCATVGKDPRTLTKTTGKVLVNTDTCIDDVRWQNFINLARTQDYRITATLNNSTTRITTATPNNLRKMINGNAMTLRNSLTGWVDSGYSYQLLTLAWDETSGGMSGFGSDYSILSWSPANYYGFGYYGDSSNPFFVGSTYNHFTANLWILPPGVPDF